MTRHHLSLDTVPRQPWRNGGGSTRELLTWPDATDWQVRVSVADIAADGPFSAFPGVQRAFAVLTGAGVRLQRGDAAVTLDTLSAPHHFDGGQPPDCRLTNGVTTDLNLMVTGPIGSARMRRVAADEDAGLPAGPRWRGVFVAEGTALLRCGTEPVGTLPAGTLLWSDNDPHDWQLDPPHPTTPLRAFWLATAP